MALWLLFSADASECHHKMGGCIVADERRNVQKINQSLRREK
jgi:hypothetical protein